MKKVIAWLLVLSLTAAISIGATLAYLTDTDEDVNVMTLGKVKIDQLEYERVNDETADEDAKVQEFHDNKPLYPAITGENFDYTPGDTYVDWTQIGKDGYTDQIWDPTQINNELDKMVFVKNKGDYDALVRSWIAFEAGNYTVEEFKKLFHLNINETDWTWEWQDTVVAIPGENGATTNYVVAVATYNKVLKPGQLTEISLSQIALDSSVGNEDIKVFGDTYQILVKTQAIQADGFETAVMALNESFGAAHPFKTDTPIKGIDVRTALHNLNGDPKQVITTKVKNVIFGKTADHRDIANSYDGVLVDEEQDVPVYTYYVPNGNGYDVYFLAEDEVFLPKNSNRLFQGMSALTAVDTSNLNTGRAEDMGYLFYLCPALKDIDVSDFDTSRATTLRSAFNGCTVLPPIDMKTWDTSKVTDMSNLFKNCKAMTTIDMTGLDMDSVEFAEYVFNGCTNLVSVKMDLDMSPVGSTRGMFMNCYSLASVEGMSNWYMPNNRDLYYMFQRCYALKSLDLSKWGIQSVKDIEGTFFYCTGLESVDVSGWNVSNAPSMDYTFYFCQSLKEIKGIGAWDISNMTSLHQTFRECVSLEALDVKNWDTGNVVSFSSTFAAWGQNTGAMKLKDIDVSQWDMSSAEDINWMFYGCGQLTDLDLSNWDVSNVKTMHHTFADCFKMENYNFTGWDTSNVISMNGIFNSNLALRIVNVSDFDTQNIDDFNQFFDGCSSLEKVIGMDKWDTSSGTSFFELFTGTKVREVDLSSFDMSNAKDTRSMFSGNYELTTIYVGDSWNLDPAQLDTSGGMFGGNPKLTGANGTTTSGNPTDATYARVDTPAVLDAEGNVITEAAPGYFTHINDRVTE